MTTMAFYNNPTIRKIAEKPKWTISTGDKVPLDMFEFQTKHVVRGAAFEIEGSTMTLEQVDGIFARQGVPSNHTFYLDVMDDELVVLDVEPNCPDEIKRRLLKLPYLYGETSMSGNGLHLVFPKPKNFHDFEAASKKLALKGENKYYEILLLHWVTFTGNPIEPITAPNVNDQTTFEAFYEKLAAVQTSTSNTETPFDMGDIALEDIPHSDKLLELLVHANPFNNTPAHYDNDMSRWELAWVRFKYEKMLIAMHVHAINPEQHVYTLQERAALLHETCAQALPHRPKHDTYRTSQFNDWYEQLVHRVISSNTRPDDPAYIEYMKGGDPHGESET